MKVGKNGDVSFWYADIGGLPAYRPSLPGDCTADICIVGAGFTGLWTAYYLKKAMPSLDIVVVEKEFAGFGGSGRNGGWVTGGFGWSRERYAKSTSRAAVVDLQRALWGTIDEIQNVAQAEGIDADFRRADNMFFATLPAQFERLKARFAEAKEWNSPEPGMAVLTANDVRQRINIANVHGAMLIPNFLRIQPAKLVRGLAEAVIRLGVKIYENTAVLTIEKGKVTTDRGIVRAEKIVRATEGFTAGIPGNERLWLPVNSAIITTEPLSEQMWKEIGWSGYEVIGEAAHKYSYMQRTREGRISVGGRGVPYRYGSRTDVRGQTQQATVDELVEILHRVFPQARDVKIAHAHCGVLGVPRDWCATVGLDPATGIAWAGGYVGVGVSTSNLTGRTLADLLLGRQTELTRLPWVNRQVRKWEPEPLRWLGLHSMYQLYNMADKREAGGSPRTSRLAKLADFLTGHH